MARKAAAPRKKRGPALPRGFALYSFKMQLAWLISNGYEKEAARIKAEVKEVARAV